MAGALSRNSYNLEDVDKGGYDLRKIARQQEDLVVVENFANI